MRRFALAFGSIFLLLGALLAWDTTPGPVAPDGTKAAIDLPTSQHMTNVGGSDGAGLCVPTSITVAARWQNLSDLYGYRKFCESRPGGSYPEKTDADLAAYCKRNGVPVPPYVQHTGGDESFLDLCIATRRVPGITYAGMDGFYDSAVAHMVDLAALDKTHGAIIDNNRAGSWVWGSRMQILNRWKGLDDSGKELLVPTRLGVRIKWQGVGGGWAFVWLGPPAPPRPPLAGTEDRITVIRTWEREEQDDGVYWFLYERGQLSWVIDADAHWHKASGPDSWEPEPQEQPEGVAAPSDPEPTVGWDQGIAVERVDRRSRYWISGIECSRAKAFAAVADPGGALLDDSDKYHLSIVGDKTLASLFAPGGKLERFTRRLHVQFYTVDAWPTKDRIATTVQLQEPAKIGGRIVGTATTATVESLTATLSSVFDPPKTPVKPATSTPWSLVLAFILALGGATVIKGASSGLK